MHVPALWIDPCGQNKIKKSKITKKRLGEEGPRWENGEWNGPGELRCVGGHARCGKGGCQDPAGRARNPTIWVCARAGGVLVFGGFAQLETNRVTRFHGDWTEGGGSSWPGTTSGAGFDANSMRSAQFVISSTISSPSCHACHPFMPYPFLLCALLCVRTGGCVYGNMTAQIQHPCQPAACETLD